MPYPWSSLDILTAANLNSAISAVTFTWADWTPTMTNLTLGSGTRTARYCQTGKLVHYRFRFVYGSGSAVGTQPQITMPVTPASHLQVTDQGFPGYGSILDTGTARREICLLFVSGSTIKIKFFNSTPTDADITSTSPWTWATGDTIEFSGTYEAA